MAIIGKRRGPISGMTHIYLLRESLAEREARSAAQAAAAEASGEPSVAPIDGARAVEAATLGDAVTGIAPAMAE
jgi:hypothetical protein